MSYDLSNIQRFLENPWNNPEILYPRIILGLSMDITKTIGISMDIDI
jgi:hypothetical protein